MRYIVTGAAGFIGSKISRDLALAGHDVIGVDNFNDYYDVELKQLRVDSLLSPLSVKVEKLDICDAPQVDEVIQRFKPDGIFHLAAQAGVRTPLADISKYLNSNLVGFTNVIKSALIHEVPNFIYASSSSVYGDSVNFPYREDDYNLSPKSYYGVTKRTNEMIAKSLVPTSRTKARGLRFFTVYGPWGRPDMAYFRLINSAIHGSEFDLFGDGTVERDFTYIDDVSRSSIKLMTQLNACQVGYNDLVNIGGGTPVSMLNLIQEIEARSGMTIKLKKHTKYEGDVLKTIASSKYLSQLIETSAFTNIKNGIEPTLSWAISSEIKSFISNWVRTSQ
jgi:UDP-glucuronate 4-epimerase